MQLIKNLVLMLHILDYKIIQLIQDTKVDLMHI